MWSRYAIQKALRNELYRGVLVWSRKKKVRQKNSWRPHNHFDTLLVGTEVGTLVDKTPGNDGSGLKS
jgi:hypothetical protein